MQDHFANFHGEIQRGMGFDQNDLDLKQEERDLFFSGEL